MPNLKNKKAIQPWKMDENISQIVSSCNSFQKVCKWQRLLVTPFKVIWLKMGLETEGEH